VSTGISRASVALALLTVVLNGGAQIMLRGAALRGASPTEPSTRDSSSIAVAYST